MSAGLWAAAKGGGDQPDCLLRLCNAASALSGILHALGRDGAVCRHGCGPCHTDDSVWLASLENRCADGSAEIAAHCFCNLMAALCSRICFIVAHRLRSFHHSVSRLVADHSIDCSLCRFALIYGWTRCLLRPSTESKLLQADWDKEAFKAANVASKEEEAVLERQSLDIPRHSTNGVREPLMAGSRLEDNSRGQGEEQCCSRREGEGHAERCCSRGAAQQSVATSDSTYEVVAECSAAPIAGDAK